MPRDERKRQKALMKKRSKQKVAAQHRAHAQAFTSQSTAATLRNARNYPLYECLISATWQEDEPGLVEIVLARQQPDGDICFGVYLVDKLCLGLKNTFANANFSRSRYEDDIRDKVASRSKLQDCPIELAHQMIYQSIASQ